MWTPIRHCPSSGLNTLFIRLDSLQSGHINLSYQGGCRKEDNNQNDNLPEVLAANTRKTESSTIVKYLRYFEKVAEQANLTCVNIVQDIGTIVAELKVVWNCLEEFGNVIIHPGDFQIRRKTFRLIWIHVFRFIRFLFNIACCSQR